MTTDLSSYICLDTDSGAFFGAERSYLIDTRDLSDEELLLLCEGTDTERTVLAKRHGLPIQTSA